MATDNEQLVLSISADTRQIQRQLKTLIGQTQRDTKAIESAFVGIDRAASGAFTGVAANSNRAFGAASNGARQLEQAMKGSRIQTSNLAAQFNDIGVQLAGGQSPFLIALQQGTQITQALGPGAGLRGTVAALGGAFVSLLNPVSLATIATIALGGAAVQYFSEWLSDGKKTSAEIEKQAALVQKVADKYGVAVPALREYADELQRAADAAERLEALQATRGNVTEGFAEEFDRTTQSILDIVSAVPDANREFGVLASKIKSNSQTADDFQRVIEALNQALEQTGSEAVRSAIRELEGLQKASERTSQTLSDIDGNMKAVTLTMGQFGDLAARLTSQMLGLGDTGAGAIKQIADAVGSYLGPAMRNASGILDTMGKTLDSVGKSQGSAAGLIKGFEGFRTNAYFDVNAYRTGYGSDTTTRADGTIEKVTKDTIVTLEDAERDLSRRIVEFQSGIQKAIGIDTWRSLSEGQQAALTSIAYNYGSLPDSIVKAIQGGGGPEKVANAIAALTANPGRRKQEAQSYLTGTGISMSEAGLGNRKTPQELFQGDVEQVQKRIDVLNAEYEAQSRLGPLINDYGYAVEKAKIQQQLLSEAQRAGLEITPEIAASIGTLAENYARASSASEQLQASQQNAARAAEDFKSTAKDVTSGFISDLRNGVSAADALANALDKVVDKLLDVALNSVFGIGGKGPSLLGGGGKGGLLGGSIIPGILHSGGVAGRDGYGHGRSVSPSVFAGAKRYHTGGIAGLQPGEVPAILQRGEMVLPRGSKIGSGGGSYAPTYNIDARGADQAAVARLERGLADRDRTESKRVAGYNQRSQVRKVRP
jgi:GH24 family phage-related lysozyme (muramidase)